jgi:UDP-N-acetylmuramoyl-tripeptide--D-alanyl-D-alanine ligase
MIAAIAVAMELGISIEKIQSSVPGFEGVFGRCSSYEVKNGPLFILDTAKAPYETLGLAFNTIKKYQSKRKWIIVGQISDYPGNPKPKYRNAYNQAKEIADKVIFIGPHSHRTGANIKTIESGEFLSFTSFPDFVMNFKEKFTEEDIVLIKSSQGMHLERIAFSLDKKVACIEDVCGYDFSCQRCGLYENPFSDHKRIRKEIRK